MHFLVQKWMIKLVACATLSQELVAVPSTERGKVVLSTLFDAQSLSGSYICERFLFSPCLDRISVKISLQSLSGSYICARFPFPSIASCGSQILLMEDMHGSIMQGMSASRREDVSADLGGLIIICLGEDRHLQIIVND